MEIFLGVSSSSPITRGKGPADEVSPQAEVNIGLSGFTLLLNLPGHPEQGHSVMTRRGGAIPTSSTYSQQAAFLPICYSLIFFLSE